MLVVVVCIGRVVLWRVEIGFVGVLQIGLDVILEIEILFNRRLVEREERMRIL